MTTQVRVIKYTKINTQIFSFVSACLMIYFAFKYELFIRKVTTPFISFNFHIFFLISNFTITILNFIFSFFNIHHYFANKFTKIYTFPFLFSTSITIVKFYFLLFNYLHYFSNTTPNVQILFFFICECFHCFLFISTNIQILFFLFSNISSIF